MTVISISGLIFGILLLLFGGGCLLAMADIGIANAIESLITFVFGIIPVAWGAWLLLKSIKRKTEQ